MANRNEPPAPDTPRQVSRENRAKFRAFLKEELQAAARYQMMARNEKDPSRRNAFERMVEMELKHAAHWADVLGLDSSRLRPARMNVGLLMLKAITRVFGTARIIPFLARGEAAGAKAYMATPEAAALVPDERAHQVTLRHMAAGKTDSADQAPHPEGGFLKGEGGTLRAAVLGVNDGLVSNFSLVMGVAGGTQDPKFIILAGVAGLLAGAFSMAAGEYISMRSQRDVYVHLIETEKAEIEQWPEEEQQELSFIYQRKGLTKQEANLVAARLMQDKKVALETKVREELGLDPDDLGSPWGAAFSSMAAFIAGAIVPILPFLVGAEGGTGIAISAGMSAAALTVVGAGLAWFSGVNALWGAARMILAGGAAATVTFGVGKAIGASVN